MPPCDLPIYTQIPPHNVPGPPASGQKSQHLNSGIVPGNHPEKLISTAGLFISHLIFVMPLETILAHQGRYSIQNIYTSMFLEI